MGYFDRYTTCARQVVYPCPTSRILVVYKYTTCHIISYQAYVMVGVNLVLSPEGGGKEHQYGE